MTISQQRPYGLRSRKQVGWVSPVRESHLPQAWELAQRDAVANAFVLSRIDAARKDMWRLGGALLGYFTEAGLHSLLYVGANIVPVQTTDASRTLFAQELIRSGRRSSSMLGSRHEVLGLWSQLEKIWGTPREIRESQPLLALKSRATGTRDGRVAHVTEDQLALLFPASVHMFTEEVGVSPLLHGGEDQYRRRVAEVIAERKAFAIIEDSRVIFKAEVGFATSEIAQLQGVWVIPELRGQGLAAPALASVVDLVHEEIAPNVTLYVNDFNHAARNVYARIGFDQVGEFATVLF
jgi:uncharacterized protein